jgi:hypothetical protein
LGEIPIFDAKNNNNLIFISRENKFLAEGKTYQPFRVKINFWLREKHASLTPLKKLNRRSLSKTLI